MAVSIEMLFGVWTLGAQGPCNWWGPGSHMGMGTFQGHTCACPDMVAVDGLNIIWKLGGAMHPLAVTTVATYKIFSS